MQDAPEPREVPARGHCEHAQDPHHHAEGGGGRVHQEDTVASPGVAHRCFHRPRRHADDHESFCQERQAHRAYPRRERALAGLPFYHATSEHQAIRCHRLGPLPGVRAGDRLFSRCICKHADRRRPLAIPKRGLEIPHPENGHRRRLETPPLGPQKRAAQAGRKSDCRRHVPLHALFRMDQSRTHGGILHQTTGICRPDSAASRRSRNIPQGAHRGRIHGCRLATRAEGSHLHRKPVRHHGRRPFHLENGSRRRFVRTGTRSP